MPGGGPWASLASSLPAALAVLGSSVISSHRRPGSLEVIIPAVNCTCECDCPQREFAAAGSGSVWLFAGFLALLAGVSLGRCSVRTRVLLETAAEGLKVCRSSASSCAEPVSRSPGATSAASVFSPDELSALARSQVTEVRRRLHNA